MKRCILAMLLVALAAMLPSIARAQSTSAVVNVSAEIPKVCRFISTSANLSIGHGGGQIDPLSTAQANGNTTLQYFCGSGILPQFATAEAPSSWGPGQNAQVTITRAGGSETMTASVTVNNAGDAPAGQGYSTSLDVSVMGVLAPTEWAGKPDGNYTGSQTFLIRAQP